MLRVTRGNRVTIDFCIAGGAFLLALIYSLYWFSYCDRKLLLFLALLGSLLIASLVFIHRIGSLSSDRRRLFAIGIVLALFCFIFTFLFPPLSVPDEGHHYMSTYWLSDMLLGQASFDGGSHFPVRSEDYALYEFFSGKSIGIASFDGVFSSLKLFANPSLHSVDMSLYSFTIGSENVLAKVGSVLGLTVGRLVGLGAIPTFYLGRLGSGVFYSLCVIMAIKLTPVGKSVFTVAALLPMSLHLAASYSYDSGIIALSFLLIAVALRLHYGDEAVTPQEMITAIILAAAVTPLKVVYAAIVFLLLIVPSRRFDSARSALIFKVVICASCIASFALIRLSSVASLAASSSGGLDERLGEVGHYYTLSQLLSNPVATLGLLFRTIDNLGDFYLLSMFGYSLGQLQGNLQFPFFFVVGMLIVCLISAQRTEMEGMGFSPGIRILFITIASLCLLGLMISMALGWTFDTENVIQGVQGRYLLPVLPLLLMCFRSTRLRIEGDIFSFSLTSISIINILYLIRFGAMALMLP